MIEIVGDLFKQQADVLCITTNGYIKATGECVMGMGCAKQAATINKKIPRLLGNAIKKNGNVVNHIIDGKKLALYSFPVKPVSAKCLADKSNVVRHMKDKVQAHFPVMGWACVAQASIIVKSAKELVELADANGWTKVVIPRPGCGAGELNWADIKPLLDQVLDDRFYSITFK
tara:strand:+ start:385 stop:903 length:519 start_codon:yes stop_codon:yes gene_type:complete